MSDKALQSRARRHVLVLAGSSSACAVLSLGCGKQPQFSCDEGGQLSPKQLELRARVKYTDRAPKVELQCVRCVQYISAQDGRCGQCKVMPGPTHPQGYCTLFAAAG